MQLVIANKNYSSWSMRPWVLMTHFDLPFQETLVMLAKPDTVEIIRRYSPSGRLPCLIDGRVTVWDSLAICETLAERFPEKTLWPTDPVARARARSISAEMHAGFAALRNNMPMNIRARASADRLQRLDADTHADIGRIDAIWSEALAHSGGPFLFGEFSIADAMYVAVVMRFQTYGPVLSRAAADYMARVIALPAVQSWIAAAEQEEGIARYEEVL
ncbi:glutathione S-transferase family protein [Robbsia andropogonis]|uniref:glutathione S-transferase family protein n=1 Tax=Robbsia andropogonis TaxID=28092 RepID=UPI003D1A1106